MNKKNSLYIGISLLVFLLLALLYVTPVFTGKELMQPDIVHYKGGAKELLDYRAQTGKETYWSDSMFGGMPTYQTGAQFRGDWIKYADNVLNMLPKPANYLFLLFAGFFFLGMVTMRNWKYALLGATFFGLSTYFYIIIAAGHNAKVASLTYFAPLMAGLVLTYIRRNYLWGFVITTIFMALELVANHPQMTYYLFIAFGFFFLSELLRAFLKTKDFKHFGIATAITGIAILIGVGMNSQRLMANMEYVKETVRGKQIISTKDQKAGDNGLDRESLTAWSYGKLETLNLFIPRLMGGGSQEAGSDKMMEKLQELVQENATSQKEVDAISQNLSSLTYWGEQPGTSGPAYQGAIVIFLAILGFFFIWPKYRWWILGASGLTIALAWGSNFAPLTDFFIDFVPMYNKFRAPSSILVVVEFLFPFVAMVGLYRFLKDGEFTEEYKQKKLLYVSGGVLGITIILLIFGKSLLGFSTDNEAKYMPPYILSFLVDERYSMFRTDALKAILYVAIATGMLFLALKKKISSDIAILVIGIVSLFDLWSVNKKYLNDDNFVSKTFAKNPFITEDSESLEMKAGGNSYITGLIRQAPINKVLETIAEKDKSHYRIFNTVLSTFSETNTSYFANSIGGYHAAKLRRYDDLINHYLMDKPDPKILNLLNTKYVIIADEKGVQQMINPESNGNAWLVSDVKFVNNPNEELNYLEKIDNKKTAIVNVEDKNYFNGKPLQADPSAKIELKSYEPNNLEFTSVSATPQLAVFSEIYYPKGWKVMLDGKEVPYIKADYLLRAVYVPAGKHEIEMTFTPKVIQTGGIFSMTSVLIFLLLAMVGFFFLNKKKKLTSTVG